MGICQGELGSKVKKNHSQRVYASFQVTSSSAELHYRSLRPGLGSWVVGICEKVAADFYGQEVHFKLLRGREDGSCDHEVGAQIHNSHLHPLGCA